MTSVSFNVTINNDTVLEDNETFHLIIRNLLPSDVTVTYGEFKCTVVTIVNNGGSGKHVCNVKQTIIRYTYVRMFWNFLSTAICEALQVYSYDLWFGFVTSCTLY